MKKTKKILSLIMIMILAMALTGCGKKDTSDQLIGKWELTFDYSAVIEDELGSDYDGFHEEFDLTVCLDFNADGTFAMYVDEESLAPTLQNYLESLAQYATDLTYEEFEGYSKAEVDEMAEEQFGMSIYDYMLEQFVTAVTAEDIAGEMYTSGVYEAKGDEVHMDEYEVQDNIYDVFKVEGNTLTLNPPEGAEVEYTGIEGFDYPYVFTRVAE
ncbi:MAG: hypothetical protein J1E61_07150 [Lachnospiraceae bacterium]|nr:hypothetical protein [Lachnospiraceae bacterium]